MTKLMKVVEDYTHKWRLVINHEKDQVAWGGKGADGGGGMVD